MSVSIYDIAKKAGVAPSTVSRALEDHPRIGATTKKRIQELAREMDYVPSTVAKSLAANKTWTIGMVLATISDPFMGRVVEGVEQAAIEVGFTVIVSTSQHDHQRGIAGIEMLQQRRVDGIIVIASHLFDQYPRFYGSSKVPIVIINEQKPGETMHFVTVDDVHGAQLAVEHLIALGHRRIGYVGVTNHAKSNQYRLKGYQDALEVAGIASDPALIFTSDTIEDHAKRGEASLEPLLAAGATAVFCFNDTTAMGLLAACHKRGLSVPDNLSVVGFDDIDMAAYTHPPLTTIRQPRFELGQRAMHMMLNLLAGQEPENQILPGELVVRQTTALLLPCKNLGAAS
ncbi:MAG TPA: LacI family DNA-binding transcriptional regulator [Ktedonobacteraceae bacterium]|nr:LacI family DNA-binding transcriptional regulator [Ktedonobacteraceae bacterium]